MPKVVKILFCVETSYQASRLSKGTRPNGFLAPSFNNLRSYFFTEEKIRLMIQILPGFCFSLGDDALKLEQNSCTHKTLF